MLWNGDGTLTDSGTVATGDSPRYVTLGDLIGDGVLDMLGVNRASDSLSIFMALAEDGVSPLLSFSLSTRADALQALGPLERKLRQLGEQRGVVGAFQSRLASATSTLQATAENYRAAESRILDADIAAESAKLVRLNILRSAASAVLAQANLQPEIALRLLE